MKDVENSFEKYPRLSKVKYNRVTRENIFLNETNLHEFVATFVIKSMMEKSLMGHNIELAFQLGSKLLKCFNARS